MSIYNPANGYVQNENTNQWYKPRPQAAVTPAAPAAVAAPAAPYVAPTTATTATPDEYWNQAKNLNRRVTQGGWSAGLDTLKQQLGGAGFRVGESGVATGAVSNYLQNQAEGMGRSSTELAVEGAKNKFLQNFSLDQFNEQKNQWGREFGASREDRSMDDMLRYMEMMNQNQTTPYAAYWGGLNNAINS